MKYWIVTFLLVLVVAPITGQQRPDAPEYAQRGPYPVGTRDYVIENDDRALNLTVWYPALNPDGLPEEATYSLGLFEFYGRALAEAEPDTTGGPYPLVVFSHGSGGFRMQSLYFTEHLASYGFVVAAVDHATNTILETLNEEAFNGALGANYIYRPQDIVRTIDYVETLNDDGVLANMIDMERIATTGHSFGGYTALAASGERLNLERLAQNCAETTDPSIINGVCFLVEDRTAMADVFDTEFDETAAWPAISDPRIDVAIALAPWNQPILDLDTLNIRTIPTLIMVGSNDTVTPANRDSIPIYQRMRSAPRTLVLFNNAGHYIFVDKCGDVALQFGFFESCSDDVWDMDRVHDLTNHYATAFLLRELYGQNTSSVFTAQAITGVSISNDVGSLGSYSAPQDLVPEVIERFPHDTEAWTQGLLLHEGTFYESTGQYGESDLRQVDPETGEVLRIVSLNEAFFAEGLALVDDRLIQITWRENTAIEFDLETFQPTRTFTYSGEGWGLCYDGSDLYMSNGSAEITRRDPVTFDALDTFTVTLESRPVDRLNELECVGDHIYANVWQTNYIMRFDKETGIIDQRINAVNLRQGEEISGDVLNGIAFDGENFYITGKLWPTMYYVRFVPAG